jgi:hypothetical protein
MRFTATTPAARRLGHRRVVSHPRDGADHVYLLAISIDPGEVR